MLMPSIFHGMDDFFDDNFNFPVLERSMKTDIKDLENSYELSVELPGYTKEEMNVELKNGSLIVSAEKTKNNDEKDEEGKYIRRERYFGKCQRSFYVGRDIKQEDIQAEFKDGILHINVPKKEEAKEEQKLIEIK